MFNSNLQKGSAAGWVIAIIVVVLIILGIVFHGDREDAGDDLDNGTTTADVLETGTTTDEGNADNTAAGANAEVDLGADVE